MHLSAGVWGVPSTLPSLTCVPPQEASYEWISVKKSTIEEVFFFSVCYDGQVRA